AEQQVIASIERLLAVQGTRTVDSLHRELGLLLWDKCGMARNAAGLRDALARLPELRERFWAEVRVTGSGQDLNKELEKAGRVADYMEFAELMCRDALVREESCGGHFREEHQDAEGEAQRDDERFAHVTVWEHQPDGREPIEHREPLEFERVKPGKRSYK